MLIFVIAVNLSLTVLNFYVVYRLWRWRQYLLQINLTLERVESYCDRFLSPAPEVMRQAQSSSQHIRQCYAQLEQSLEQIQSILGIVRFTIRFLPPRQAPSLQKSNPQKSK